LTVETGAGGEGAASASFVAGGQDPVLRRRLVVLGSLM